MAEDTFRVGDRVRLLDGSKIPDYVGTWVAEMGEYVGNIDTIIAVDIADNPIGYKSDKPIIGYYMEKNGYVWDERGIEFVETPPCIIAARECASAKQRALELERLGDIEKSASLMETMELIEQLKTEAKKLLQTTKELHEIIQQWP